MPTLFVAFEDRVLRVWEPATDNSDTEEWAVEECLDGMAFEAVAAHPDTPRQILVGTSDSGVCLSEDGGGSWGRTGRETIEEPVTALASDPSDPERFYVGTEPSRVYVTEDSGETWATLDGLTDLESSDSWAFPPRPSTHHVRWIEIDPTDPEHLYVAVEAGALVRSFDGGETWEDRVDSGRWDTHSMATHPDAPKRAWAAAGDGFAETTDGGETWTYPQQGLGHRYCWSVAVDTADTDTLLMSAALGPGTAHTSASAESYVYRRSGVTDAAWQLAGDGLPHGKGMLRPVIQSGFQPGEAFLASNLGLWRTASMGETWESIDIDWPDALTDQTVRGLVVLP